MISSVLPEVLRYPLGQCAGTHAEIVRCHSYNFVSGIGSDISEVALITGPLATIALVLWRKHVKRTECHEVDCHEHGKYVLEGGVRACDTHHPALDERPVDERGHVQALHVGHLDLLVEHSKTFGTLRT